MALQDSTLTTFAAFLKQKYIDFPDLETVSVRNRVGPLCTMLMEQLEPDFNGVNAPYPIMYGGSAGATNTFSAANTDSTASLSVAPLLTRVPYYKVVGIDNQNLRASNDITGAFLSAKTVEIDNARLSLMLKLAADLYLDGTGNIGQIASTATVASATLILADPTTSIRFSAGQTIVASPNANGSSPRTGSAVISGVNNNAGTITTAGGNWSTQITPLSTTDYLFVDGAIGAGVCVTGLGGWLPTTAPSSSPLFFGIDRSVDSGLYGTIYDGTSLNIREALTNALTQANIIGGFPTQIYVHPQRWADLSLLMQSNGRYMSQPSDGVAGFDVLKIALGTSLVEVFADRWCPYNQAYGINPEDVNLLSLDEFPNFIEQSGSMMLVDPNNDGWLIRMVGYLQLGIRRPAYQFVCKLGAA